MRGDLVIVRTYGGKPLVRRVWGVGPNSVYITNDEQFQKLINNVPALEPISFPKEDVFVYDRKLVVSMEDMDKSGKFNWSKVVPYEAEN